VPAGGVSHDAIDPRLLDVLGCASSLELLELSTLIERMLADPRRIVAVRANMHLGQTVRFSDPRDGAMRTATVVAMRSKSCIDTRAIVPTSTDSCRRRCTSCWSRTWGCTTCSRRPRIARCRAGCSRAPTRGSSRG
jgi:hypothetical protein